MNVDIFLERIILYLIHVRVEPSIYIIQKPFNKPLKQNNNTHDIIYDD